MENKERSLKNNIEDEMVLKRGPWTSDEDFKLINYISTHGEGRWNSLSRSAGLQRTGKSCRLRWLNYLRPDVRRGNISLEEQLLILELHSRWGNRWSKIAQYLPGRTDNEIKNYWRTRVQKHAKQLKCDVNSKKFKDTMKYLWMPRLLEKIQSATVSAATTTTTTGSAATSSFSNNQFMTYDYNNMGQEFGLMSNITPENSSVAMSPTSDLTENYSGSNPNPDYYSGQLGIHSYYYPENYFNYNGLLDEDLTAMQEQSGLLDEDLTVMEDYQKNLNWFENINGVSSSSDSLWSDEDFWFLQQNQQLLNI